MKIWWLLIPAAIGLIGLICGTFFDLPFSQAVVNQESIYGQFFEGWGMLLPFVMSTLGGAALAGGLWQCKNVVWKIVGILVLLSGFYASIFEAKVHICNSILVFDLGQASDAVLYTVLSVIVIGIGFSCFLIFRKCDRETMIRLGIIVILLSGFQAGIAVLLKKACYRPRFRYIAGYVYDDAGNVITATPDMIGLYRAWFEDWQWFSAAKYIGIPSSDCIKSFPSSHTGNAALLLMLPAFLPCFIHKTEKLRIWQPIMFVLSLLYLMMLAFGRVQIGAHFLSDVCFMIAITPLLGIALFAAVVSVKNAAGCNK